MARLRVAVLGSPVVRHGDRDLTFPTRKVLAILVYLLVEGGQHRRETLVDLFWPGSDEDAGRATLRSTLARLRETLQGAGGDAHLLVRRDSVGFDPDSDHDLDLHHLRSATDVARVLASGARPTGEQRRTVSAQLERGAASWRGDFLQGFSLRDAPDFDDWVGLQRAFWRYRMEVVLDQLSALLADTGESAAAIDVVIRWLALNPLDERAHRRLIELRAAVGDQTGALEAYATCCAVLDRELGVRPEPQTTALAVRLRASSPRLPEHPGTLRPVPGPLEGALVGREDEFAALADRFHAAARGRPQAVVIRGEAGIGKTRLATEFLAWAAARGADALQGRAFEAAGRLPYQPLVDAARPRLEREPDLGALLGTAWLGELGLLMPELRERRPELPAQGGDEAASRTRLFEAWARLGQALARRAPLVLLVDDLQWADATSLDVLRYAARRWVQVKVPVLLVVALRSEVVASTPALAEWLTGLRRDLDVAELDLGPLAFDDAVRLLRSLRPTAGRDPGFEGFARWIFAETGGQPFFLVETLRALAEQGVLVPRRDEKGAWVVDAFAAPDRDNRVGFLPEGVRRVVQARLTPLHPVARDLLAAAAVLGQGFCFERLCEVGRLREEEGLPALDTVVEGQLLREVADGGGRPGASAYTFAHDKIRDVVYAEAGEARRRVLHRRALEILEREGAPAAELTRHALAAGLAEPGLRYSMAAGDEARRLLAARDAAAYYRQAIELADRLSRADLLADLHARRGRAFVGVAMWADARRELEAALAGVGTDAQDERAGILVDLADACFWLQDVPAVRRHATEALALAKHLGHGEFEAKATAWLATAEGSDGNLPASVAGNQRAIARARELGVAPPPVAHFRSMALYWLGRPEEAVEGAHEAVATARRANDVSWTMWALPSLGLALAGTGRYDAAADVFAEARRLGRDYGAETLLARSIACSAGFRLDLYDFAGAEAVSEEAREMAWSLGFAPPAISAGIDLIMNYARRGKVDRAERVVAEVVDGVEQAAGFHGWLWRLRLAEARAELALARGEWEDAIRLADEAAGQSRTRGRAKYEILGLVTRAAGLTASGRSREALAALESAVALARPVGDPALFLRAAAGLLAIGGSDALAAEGRAVWLRVAEGLSDSDLRCQFRNAEALQVVSR